jgi:hypothetical protein
MMFTPRRFYIYTVTGVSLQAVTWSAILLLRNLLVVEMDPPTATIAFQVAIILIGLPLFVVNWRWGQRLSLQDEEERGAVLRRIFLYVMLGVFFGAILFSTFCLMSSVLHAIAHLDPPPDYAALSPLGTAMYHLIGIVVLALASYTLRRVIVADVAAVPERGATATVRRLFVLAFSVTGLIMSSMGTMLILRWLLFQIAGSEVASISQGLGPMVEIARLVVGLPVWILFWRWAQRLFFAGAAEERESALRKFMLYTVVFVSVLTVVTSGTFILESLLRRLLAITAPGGSGGDVRVPLSAIVVMGALWAYHASVIRSDTKLVEEAPRQAVLRRLYLYLIAAIGLAAFLVGISGIVSTLIRSLGEIGFGVGLKRQVSWSTAIIFAGLPVWALPWRGAQAQSTAIGTEGARERSSLVRKTYLYFFLLIATLTMLSSLVYIVFRILNMILGAPAPTLLELGQPIAFSLIALGVWLYHGAILRDDRQRFLQDQAARYESFKIVLLDLGESGLVQGVRDALARLIPGISPVVIGQEGSVEDMEEDAIVSELQQAGLIVGSWAITLPDGPEASVNATIASAVASSPARKILIPNRYEGWEWAGVDLWDREAMVRQTVHAIQQVLEGETVKPLRPLGAGAILGIVIAVLILLSLIVMPLIEYFA